jgi:hypothetical protein
MYVFLKGVGNEIGVFFFSFLWIDDEIDPEMDEEVEEEVVVTKTKSKKSKTKAESKPAFSIEFDTGDVSC